LKLGHTPLVGSCHAEQFGCVVELGRCTAWIELTGELDIATAPELQRQLQEALAHAKLVVLDLRQLSFTDAAGLRVICEASESADADERRLMLIRGTAQVDKVLTLTGLTEKLNVLEVAKHEGNLVPVEAQQSKPSFHRHTRGRRKNGIARVGWSARNESAPRSSKAPRRPNKTQQIPREMEGHR
jgi:anti-sigma B factor antagonist